MDQATTPLLTALLQRSSDHHTPFYTPGHKRGRGVSTALREALGSAPFRLDLPELPGLDNLAAPEGVIQTAQELAAATFGADRTWFLANGSTCGVIAAILATCNPGDAILLPRNVHQSAISGLILAGATPIFIQPEYDPAQDLIYSVTTTAIAAALQQYPQIRAVLLVSPTYHGICGDIAAISQIVHQHGIPLVVDEAHGPHFAFHPELPTAALAAEADLVIQSTHKVLSALTQAAMLHMQGRRVDADRVSQALRLVQSTSPSYLLLASLDAARQQMALQGNALMSQTLALADHARHAIQQIPGLRVLQPEQAHVPGFHALDRTRLTVTVSDLGMTGFEADEILDGELGVTAEFPSLHHLTFIISLGNQAEDIDRLIQACQTLAQFRTDVLAKRLYQAHFPYKPELPSSPALNPRDAFFAPTCTVPWAEAIGEISAELICPYPPGIPTILLGERIESAAMTYLQEIQTVGGFIAGCTDSSLNTLKIIKW